MPSAKSKVSILFPKIIRYLKSLSEVNFFKGFQQIMKHKEPLSLK